MQFSLSDLRNQAMALWGRLTRRQRLIVGLSAAAIAVVLVVWANMFAAQPDYVPLFTRLEPADAGEVVKKLGEMKVPYRVEEGGSAVLVPSREVHRVRLQLAADGLPRGGVVGFEIMDKTKIGMTDFERRLSYMRALQGELTRTIMQVEGVESARVHVVLPEPSIYFAKERPATAAVFLSLEPYATLNPEQVRGIIHLVSHSVEGLRSEDVTVVDMRGRILSQDLEEAMLTGSKVAANQLELQQAFQKQLERSVQTFLEQVLGPGNVVARVNAVLNFDEKVVERQFFEPAADAKQLVRSYQELKEYFKGEGTTAGGVPGVTSNIPGYPQVSQAGPVEYEKSETVKNLEMNEVKENIVVSPGAVSRLSVSVVVNKALTVGERKAIEQAVAAAIGYDPSRRDQVTVEGMPFDTTALDEMKAAMEAEKRAAERRAARLNQLLVLLGAVLVVAVAVAGRRRRRARELVAQAEAVATRARAEAEVPSAEREKQRVRDEIFRLARQKPEDVARILKTWLAEE